MKILTNILNLFIPELETNNLYDIFTNLGYEVENYEKLTSFDGVVIGKTKECQKHPNADSLSYCKISEYDNENFIDIVCGGKNVDSNQIVFWAKPDSTIRGIKLLPKELRGIVSNGMIASLPEMGDFNDKFYDDNLSHSILSLDSNNFEEQIKKYGLDGEVYDISILPDRVYANNYHDLAIELSTVQNKNIVGLAKEYKLPIAKGSNIDFKGVSNLSLSFLKFKISNTINLPEKYKMILYKNGLKPFGDIRDLLIISTILFGSPIFTSPNNFEEIFFDGKELKFDSTKINYDNPFEYLNINNEKKYEFSLCFPTSPHKIIYKKELSIDNLMNWYYKKGTNPSNVEKQIGFILSIISQTNSDFVLDSWTYGEVLNKKYSLSNVQLKKYIKSDIDINQSLTKLNKLNFSCDYKFDEISCIVPKYRIDIDSYSSLIEEIIRFSNFEKIESIEPRKKLLSSEVYDSFNYKYKIIDFLASIGLYEVKTVDLISNDENSKYNIWNIENKLRVNKDLSIKNNNIKSNNLFSLIDVYKHNFRNGKLGFGIFEISHIHEDYNNSFSTIDILIDLELNNENLKGNELLKNIFLSLNDRFNLNLGFTHSNLKIFNPYQQAMIIDSNDNCFGYLGQLHPLILRENKFIKLDKIKTNLYYLTIKLPKDEQWN